MCDIEIEEAASPSFLLKDLQARADCLLAELRSFQFALNRHGKTGGTEMRVFCRGVESEAKSLRTIAKRRMNSNSDDEESLLDSQASGRNSLHALKSSNLPFYEAVWQTAKSCRKVIALERYMSGPPSSVHKGSPTKTAHESLSRPTAGSNGSSVLVDVIADDGLKWIKVSTITNKRLLFDIAKEGWETYCEDSSDEECDDMAGTVVGAAEKTAPRLGLVKLAESLYRASRAHRIQFKHPVVHMILPNVQEFVYDDVDAVLTDIRYLGVNVYCSTLIGSENNDQPLGASMSDDLLASLIPSSLTPVLSTEVNIDCTILLALISDISHVNRDELPTSPQNRSGTYHKAILRQIDCEAHSALLPNELYGIISGRVLLATSTAVQRMYQIADTMGTKSERRRAAIFFGQRDCSSMSSGELREELKLLSRHSVPDDLQLPIHVVDFEDLVPDMPASSASLSTTLSTLNINDDEKYLSPSPTFSAFERHFASDLRQQCNLSTINTSVFLYGWMRDIVTLTSNKVVATNINKSIDRMLDDLEQAIETEKRNNSIKNNDEYAGVDITVNLDNIERFTGPKIYICETARSLIGKERLVV